MGMGVVVYDSDQTLTEAIHSVDEATADFDVAWKG
jgi:hypothetical protein